jgi:hypothetical protein
MMGTAVKGISRELRWLVHAKRRVTAISLEAGLVRLYVAREEPPSGPPRGGILTGRRGACNGSSPHRRRTAALSLHPPTLWQVAVRPAVPARTPGIALSAIASGLQKRMKACIEAVAFVDRLKAGLKSLPQFLSRRLHSRVPLPF